MAVSFRDRFLSPRVARAMFSPSAILLTGAGAALGILTGLGPLAAIVGGAVGWGGRVLASVPRRPAGARIDAFAIGDPWRRFVLDAQQAQTKFDAVVRRARPGPIRDRLQTIGARISDGVRECWRIASQGDQLQEAIRHLDVRSIEEELSQVVEERRRGRGDDASLARTQQAIEAQLASATRLVKVANDAHDRLRLLNAQLDEAVARAVEISLQAGDVGDLSPLSQDVDSVVGELESLRQALEETSGTPATGTPGTA